jgi:uncharacterized protein YqeY
MEILSKIEAALHDAMKEQYGIVEKIKKLEEMGSNASEEVELAFTRKELEDSKERIKVIRLIKAELTKVNDSPKYHLSDDEEVGVLLKMATLREDTAKERKDAGREDLMNIELGELKIIKEFTPAQPTDEEMTAYVNTLIDDLLAKMDSDYQLSMKSMGAIMPKAKDKYPNINGNLVKQVLASRMK